MDVILGIVAALLTGTLAEYSVHRSMHGWLLKTWLGKFHAEHHRDDVCKPLVVELLLYQPVALVVIPWGLLLVPWAGWGCFLGWASGGVAYAALVGLAHWREHSFRDESDFHARHHRHPRRNYGVLVSWWDHVLGTIAPHEESVPAQKLS